MSIQASIVLFILILILLTNNTISGQAGPSSSKPRTSIYTQSNALAYLGHEFSLRIIVRSLTMYECGFPIYKIFVQILIGINDFISMS